MKELPIDKHLFFEALWYLVEKGEISMCEYRELLNKYSKKDEENESSKEEKRLWKARILDTPKNGHSVCFFQKEYYTDVREMSVKEAIEWYNDLKEHLNDFESVYDSDGRGLYYKKDGEWVRYEEK